MRLVLVDHSTAPLRVDELAALRDAYKAQLAELSELWCVAPPSDVAIAAAGEVLEGSARELGVWDRTDAPGAAGYHDRDPGGRPYGRIFRDAADAILTGGTLALATIGSHEACELWIDPFANGYAARPDGLVFDATEVCDACEDLTYPCGEGTGVALSDFLLPAAFDPGAPGPWDRAHVLTSAYDTTPGGYRITATAGRGGGLRTIALFGPFHAFARPEGDKRRLAKVAGRARLRPLIGRMLAAP